MMLKTFFKVQSLGNDFILFDWQQKKESECLQFLHGHEWKKFVTSSCDRNFGVGADGILILVKNKKSKIPQALIFNSDGSQAELCLNGLRCIAHYLYATHNFGKTFKIKMEKQIIGCLVVDTKNGIEIINEISPGRYIESKTITIMDHHFSGHVVDMGNPHFILFQKIDIKWLKKYGSLIESHNYFKNRTNVEFVWHEKDAFKMLVYERGCGITMACSSGACALVTALSHLKKINKDEKVAIHMAGGTVTCWIDGKNQKINLQAQANIVFAGEIRNNPF